MTYTSHGLMTAADLEEYRRDTDWYEVDRPEPDDDGCVHGLVLAKDCVDCDAGPCWVEEPGGGVRCGLDVDHEGDHHFNIWNPLLDAPTTPAPPKGDTPRRLTEQMGGIPDDPKRGI